MPFHLCGVSYFSSYPLRLVFIAEIYALMTLKSRCYVPIIRLVERQTWLSPYARGRILPCDRVSAPAPACMYSPKRILCDVRLSSIEQLFFKIWSSSILDNDLNYGDTGSKNENIDSSECGKVHSICLPNPAMNHQTFSPV